MEKSRGAERQFTLLSRVVVILHRVLERGARDEQLSLQQYRFLLGLKRGATRATELAKHSGIGRPTASAMIDDLAKKGLVKKVPDPSDGRAMNVRLSSKGVKTYASFEERLTAELSDYLSDEWPPRFLDAVEDLAYLIDSQRGPRAG